MVIYCSHVQFHLTIPLGGKERHGPRLPRIPIQEGAAVPRATAAHEQFQRTVHVLRTAGRRRLRGQLECARFPARCARPSLLTRILCVRAPATSSPSVGTRPASASQVCGVGINFRADKSGALFVSSLIPGGASHFPQTCSRRERPQARSRCLLLGIFHPSIPRSASCSQRFESLAHRMIACAGPASKTGSVKVGDVLYEVGCPERS